MVDVRMDVVGVTKLAADLGMAGPAVVPLARAVVERSALAVKNGMARDARGHQHFPSFPNSITYDVRGLSAEIGPDKNRRQGALGNILYFGTSKNAPVLNIGAALEREAPNFERLLGDATRGQLAEAVTERRAYTTRSGVTRMATQAQIDNWTRAGRS